MSRVTDMSLRYHSFPYQLSVQPSPNSLHVSTRTFRTLTINGDCPLCCQRNLTLWEQPPSPLVILLELSAVDTVHPQILLSTLRELGISRLCTLPVHILPQESHRQGHWMQCINVITLVINIVNIGIVKRAQRKHFILTVKKTVMAVEIIENHQSQRVCVTPEVSMTTKIIRS